MDNNFSTQVKEIISYSREEALRLGNDFIGAEHLMLGLIRDQENTAIKVLRQLNVNLGELRKEIELAVKDKSGKNIANINSLPLTKQAEKVIRVTVLEAKALKSPMVETEHLLLSILKNKENIATQILNQFDVDYDLFRNELGMVGSAPSAPLNPSSEYQEEGDDDFDDEKGKGGFGGGTKSKPTSTSKSKTPVLDNFGRDITKLAEQDALDPIVLNVGWIKAGNDHTTNIVPETASFGATVRSFSKKGYEDTRTKIPAFIKSMAEAFGLEAEIEFSPATKVLINDPQAVDRVERVTKSMYGEQRYVTMEQPIPGGEDMASILEEIPGAFVFLGAAYPGIAPQDRQSNHSNKAKFDDSVLADGAALMAALAFDTLDEAAGK